MSSAQRIPNGNTLICDGVSGRIFEVAPDRTIVWQQKSPSVTAAEVRALNAVPDQGGATAAQHGFLPPVLRDEIGTSSQQNNELDEFQKEVDQTLDMILTDEQRQHLRAMTGSKSGG